MLGKTQQLILLITILLMIGFVIMLVWIFRQANKKKWPPTAQPCPDYWTIDGNSCVYGGNNGTCPITTKINFSGVSECDKSQWATEYASADGTLYSYNNGAVKINPSCGLVEWDGITYGNKPCEK